MMFPSAKNRPNEAHLPRTAFVLLALALLAAPVQSFANSALNMIALRTDPSGVDGFDVFTETEVGPPKFIWWKRGWRVRRGEVWNAFDTETKAQGHKPQGHILGSSYSNAIAGGYSTYYFGVGGELSRQGALPELQFAGDDSACAAAA